MGDGFEQRTRIDLRSAAQRRALPRALRRALLGVLLVSPIACIHSKSYRARHERSHALDGVKIRAEARLTGPLNDSLVVSIVGNNSSDEHRSFIIGGGCTPAGSMVFVRVVQGSRQWDTDAWRAALRADELARLPPPPPRDDGLVIGEVCVGFAIMTSIPPHDSSTLAWATFPVRAIVGDSLPPGRYVVRARMGGAAWAAGEKPAGVVIFPEGTTLSSPRP